ncbi:hypothetical protein EK21DRAFT_104984 [Setomelanomma holmii]|uniref:Zn(2)-C6 fungal-type domain-containing protein n=1 Tax=Setomelanomma holmii TaxID=210430 RepID=A0A9P4GYS3_9PLEO|nr:hypothetical protein EK21DRAFT_104984 [Setomelanomma holmii]
MDDDRRSPPQEPPAKRQRTLACQRCRARKQKCEDSRPCSNCVKGKERCVSTQPAPRPHVESEYVRTLEERIAELESHDSSQCLDHLGREMMPIDQARVNEASPRSDRAAGLNGPPLSASPEAQRMAAQRRLSYLSGSSPRKILASAEGGESGLDHLTFGLITSPSAARPAQHQSVSQPSPAAQVSVSHERFYAAHLLVAQLPLELEESLLEAYRERAQAQYPFFHWESFLRWTTEWKHCFPGNLKEQAWQGFFVNMQPDQVLHIQAYLLLAMHALHQSSSERIISLTSTTMRQCVQQQLRLSESEPVPSTVELRQIIQVRRRCFWCAYLLDRFVMSTFDLPPSVPDAMISVKPFANIEDRDFQQVAVSTPSDRELYDVPSYTSMAPALHILYCRRIHLQYENSPEWRIRILAELEDYKSRVQKVSDPESKGYTSQRWLAMIYHYTLLQLYRPMKSNVVGPAGDWSVQASSQACLMFRRTQIDRQIAHPWLALLVQFQSGITLLYCFWATPPDQRTENYDSLDVSDALRACSNILAIMADRWAKAECLRDVLELLAREIPLVDRPHRPPTRLSEKASTTIREHLTEVRSLIVHRPVLRMLEEMVSEDFPRPSQHGQPSPVTDMSGPILQTVQQNSSASILPPTPHFQLPFSIQQSLDYNNTSVDMENLDVDGMLSFPGIFDFDNWT